MSDELQCYRHVDRPRFTLVCFPHAGGNAGDFRAWPAHLPPDVAMYAVRYPGRLDRLHVPVARTVDEIAGPVRRALAAVPDPLVLFGHSMGAVLAHAVTADLEERGRSPVALAVSARAAPHLIGPAPTPTDDETLIGKVRGRPDVPAELLDDDEVRELMLAPLRADIELLNATRGRPARPVRAPVLAYLGTEDPGCTADEVRGWRDVTTGAFRLRLVPGDHFGVIGRPAALLADLTGRIPVPPAVSGRRGPASRPGP
jgi:pyochelin biosynthetic protein PchC